MFFVSNLPIIHWKYPTGENNLKLDKSFVGSIGEIKKGRNRQTRLNVLKSYKRVKIVVKRWCVVSIKRKHTFYRRVSRLVYYVRKHTFVILVEVKFSFVYTLEKEIDRQRVSQCEGRDRSFTTHGAFSHYLLQYNTTRISFPMNSMWEKECVSVRSCLSVVIYVCDSIWCAWPLNILYSFTIFCSFPLHGRNVPKYFFVLIEFYTCAYPVSLFSNGNRGKKLLTFYKCNCMKIKRFWCTKLVWMNVAIWCFWLEIRIFPKRTSRRDALF